MRKDKHFFDNVIQYSIDNGYVLHSKKTYETLDILHVFLIKKVHDIKFGLTLEFFERSGETQANRKEINEIEDLKEVL